MTLQAGTFFLAQLCQRQKDLATDAASPRRHLRVGEPHETTKIAGARNLGAHDHWWRQDHTSPGAAGHVHAAHQAVAGTSIW